VSRSSVKFKGDPQCVRSVPNTRPSEGITTESANRTNVRGFWGHDTAELAGSILKVFPILKTKTASFAEMFAPVSQNIWRHFQEDWLPHQHLKFSIFRTLRTLNVLLNPLAVHLWCQRSVCVLPSTLSPCSLPAPSYCCRSVCNEFHTSAW
jgi:hypothetical protein